MKTRAVPFHLRARSRGAATALSSGPRVYELDQLDDLAHDALVRTLDGAVITAAAARIGLKTFAITESLLARYGDGT